MNDSARELTDLERRILGQTADVAVTRRRIRLVIVMAAFFAVMLTIMFLRGHSPGMVFGVAIGYILITTLEKVGYGFAVLGYKSLIRKLAARVEALEKVEK